jgi:hypothetical protein
MELLLITTAMITHAVITPCYDHPMLWSSCWSQVGWSPMLWSPRAINTPCYEAPAGHKCVDHPCCDHPMLLTPHAMQLLLVTSAMITHWLHSAIWYDDAGSMMYKWVWTGCCCVRSTIWGTWVGISVMTWVHRWWGNIADDIVINKKFLRHKTYGMYSPQWTLWSYRS